MTFPPQCLYCAQPDQYRTGKQSHIFSTRYGRLGEPVVAIVADSEQGTYEAAALVRALYEELPAVFDVEEAPAPLDAPLVSEYHGQNYYRYDSGECRKVRLGMSRQASGRRITSWSRPTNSVPYRTCPD